MFVIRLFQPSLGVYFFPPSTCLTPLRHRFQTELPDSQVVSRTAPGFENREDEEEMKHEEWRDRTVAGNSLIMDMIAMLFSLVVFTTVY